MVLRMVVLKLVGSFGQKLQGETHRAAVGKLLLRIIPSYGSLAHILLFNHSAGYADFWKTSVMGGEVRPELQSSIFSNSYPAGTEYHQDFNLCVDTTHATYMVNYYAFADGYSAGNELDRAIAASNRMGYSFEVTKVQVTESTTMSSHVSVAVTVEQTGLAPFYYPLDLTLDCAGGTYKTLPGVEAIIRQGDSREFIFTNIPATQECLSGVRIGLFSKFVYLGNPVKFVQGEDGTFVTLSLPLPPVSTTASASSPVPPATTATQAPVISFVNIPATQECLDEVLSGLFSVYASDPNKFVQGDDGTFVTLRLPPTPEPVTPESLTPEPVAPESLTPEPDTPEPTDEMTPAPVSRR
jgi:hypothetical protein